MFCRFLSEGIPWSLNILPSQSSLNAASPSCVRYFCGHSSMKGAAMPFSAARCSRGSSSMASMSPTWMVDGGHHPKRFKHGGTCWETMPQHVFFPFFGKWKRIANISLGFLKLRSPRSPYSPFDGLFSQTELDGDIHHLCACFVHSPFEEVESLQIYK